MDVEELPMAKRDHPFLLGKKLDGQVQAYIYDLFVMLAVLLQQLLQLQLIRL